MKRFLIAAIALMLLLGCKSKLSRGFDKIEEALEVAKEIEDVDEMIRVRDSLHTALYSLSKAEDFDYDVDRALEDPESEDAQYRRILLKGLMELSETIEQKLIDKAKELLRERLEKEGLLPR